MGSDVSALLQADAPVPSAVLTTQHEVHANPGSAQGPSAPPPAVAVVSRCPAVRVMTGARARQLVATSAASGGAAAAQPADAASASAERTPPPSLSPTGSEPPPVLLVPDCGAPDALAKSSTYVPLLRAIFDYIEAHKSGDGGVGSGPRGISISSSGARAVCPLGLDFDPSLSLGDRLETNEARAQCMEYCKLFLTHLIGAVEHAGGDRDAAAGATAKSAPSSASKATSAAAAPAVAPRLYLLYVDARSCRLDDTTGLWFASTLIMRAVRRTRPYALVSARTAAAPTSPSSSTSLSIAGSASGAAGGGDGFMSYFSPDVKADMMWSTLQYVLLTHNNMSLQGVKAVLESLLAEDAMHEVLLQKQGVNPRALKSQEVMAAVTQDRLFPRHGSQLLPQLYLVDVRHNLYDDQHVHEVLQTVTPASVRNAESPRARSSRSPSDDAPASAPRTAPAVHPPLTGTAATTAGAAAASVAGSTVQRPGRGAAAQLRAASSQRDASSDVPDASSMGGFDEAEPAEQRYSGHAYVPSVHEQAPPLPPSPSRQREDQQSAAALAAAAPPADTSASPSPSQRPVSATPREGLTSPVTNSLPPSPQNAECAPSPIPYVAPPTALSAADAASSTAPAQLEDAQTHPREGAPPPHHLTDVSLAASEEPRMSVATAISQDPEPRHGEPPTPNAASAAADAPPRRSSLPPPPTPSAPSGLRSPHSSVQRFVKLPGETSIGRGRPQTGRDDDDDAETDRVVTPRVAEALHLASPHSHAASQSASAAAPRPNAAPTAAAASQPRRHDPSPALVTSPSGNSNVSGPQPASRRQSTRAAPATTAAPVPDRVRVRSRQASPASARGAPRQSTVKAPTASAAASAAAAKAASVDAAPDKVVVMRSSRSRSPQPNAEEAKEDGAPAGTSANPPSSTAVPDGAAQGAGGDADAAVASRSNVVEPQHVLIVRKPQLSHEAGAASRPPTPRQSQQPNPSAAAPASAPRARPAADGARDDDVDAALDEAEMEVHSIPVQQRPQPPSPPSGRRTARHLVQSGRQHLPRRADEEPWLDEVYPSSHDHATSPARSAGLAGVARGDGSARGRRRYDIAALEPPEPFFAASAARVPAVVAEGGERRRHKSPAQVAARRRRNGGPATSARRRRDPSNGGGGGFMADEYDEDPRSEKAAAPSQRRSRHGGDAALHPYVDTTPFMTREAQAKAEYAAATAAEARARERMQHRTEELAMQSGGGVGGGGGSGSGGGAARDGEGANAGPTFYGAGLYRRSENPSTALRAAVRANSSGSGAAARRSRCNSPRLPLTSQSPAPYPPDTTAVNAIDAAAATLEAEEGSEFAAAATSASAHTPGRSSGREGSAFASASAAAAVLQTSPKPKPPPQSAHRTSTLTASSALPTPRDTTTSQLRQVTSQRQRRFSEVEEAESLYYARNRQPRTTFRTAGATATMRSRHAQPLELAAMRQEQLERHRRGSAAGGGAGGVPWSTTMSSTSPLRRGDTAPQLRETAEERRGARDRAVVPHASVASSSSIGVTPTSVDFNENGVELIHSKLRTRGRPAF